MNDQEWRKRIDVRALVEDLGIEIQRVTESGWGQASCPLPEHGGADRNPSFAIKLDGGGDHEAGTWRCLKAGCAGGGDPANLVEKVKVMSQADAFRYVTEKFTRGGPPKQETRAARTTKTRKSKPPVLWSMDVIEEAASKLQDESRAMAYLRGTRAISDEIIESAKIGFAAGQIHVPVFAADGKTPVNILSCEWDKSRIQAAAARGTKSPTRLKGRRGVGCHVYPAHLYDHDRPTCMIVEGEWDALACYSAKAKNVITTTGGSSTLTCERLKGYIPTGDGSSVYLCLDNDQAGVKARDRLIQELKSEGVQEVWIVKDIPSGKDIGDVLSAVPVEDRVTKLKEVISSAVVIRANSTPHADIVETGDGRMVKMSRSGVEKVADWRGVVTRTGLHRTGGQGEACRIFELDLRHIDGSRLTVRIRQDEKFLQALRRSPGYDPKWEIQPKHEEGVFYYLSMTSKSAESRDVGFFLGFDDGAPAAKRLLEYWTPSTIFGLSGPRPNEEVDMEQENDFLRRFDLPMPEYDDGATGAECLFRHIFKSHYETYTAPLIASALLAPIRRVMFPDLPRFPLLVDGRSGSGKTSRMRLVQNLFGNFPDNQSLLTWQGTTNSIRHITSLVGDSFLLVDEMRLGNQRQTADVISFLQGVSQGVGKTRMTKGGEGMLSERPGHSIVGISTEAMDISDEGLVARSISMTLPKTEITMEMSNAMDSAQEFRHALPSFTACWIDWILSAQNPYTIPAATVFEEAEEWARSLTEGGAMDPGQDNQMHRMAQRARAISVVWYSATQLAVLLGGIEASYRNELLSAWKVAVLGIWDYQGDLLSESGEEVSLLQVLVGGLQSTRFAIAAARDEDRIQGRKFLPGADYHIPEVVGYIKKIPSSMEKDFEGVAFEFGGSHYAIGLNQRVQTIWRQAGVKTTWQQGKRRLENTGAVVRQAMPRVRMDTGAQPRLAWLSEKVGQEVLQSVLSPA